MRAAASRAEEPEQGDSGLYMHPEARRKLANASAVTFLVGSYEGWGNFGDLVQLRSALDLLAAELPHAVACPVLSLHGAASHLARASDGDAFAITRRSTSPPRARRRTASCASWASFRRCSGADPDRCLAYGGAISIPGRGIAKLQMVEAARAIGRRAGAADLPLVSSGLQSTPPGCGGWTITSWSCSASCGCSAFAMSSRPKRSLP